MQVVPFIYYGFHRVINFSKNIMCAIFNNKNVFYFWNNKMKYKLNRYTLKSTEILNDT